MIFPLNKRRQLPKEEPLPRQGFLLFHDLNYRVILRRRRGKSSSALLLKEALQTLKEPPSWKAKQQLKQPNLITCHQPLL
jgi:hypothetical protein